MSANLNSLVIGLVSGAVCAVVSVAALAYTNAFAMPSGLPLSLWTALVVFGLGASLVALIIHGLALRVSAARALPALIGFLVGVVAVLGYRGELTTMSHPVLIAWLIGALLASAVVHSMSPARPSANVARA